MALTRGAGGSIKPGVERSGAPGTTANKCDKARGAGDSRIVIVGIVKSNRCRSLRGLFKFPAWWSRGLAALHPGLLRYHPLRGFRTYSDKSSPCLIRISIF